jgi:hypothetical protein
MSISLMEKKQLLPLTNAPCARYEQCVIVVAFCSSCISIPRNVHHPRLPRNVSLSTDGLTASASRPLTATVTATAMPAKATFGHLSLHFVIILFDGVS